MLDIHPYIKNFTSTFPSIDQPPWLITQTIDLILDTLLKVISEKEFTIKKRVAIHRTVNIEEGVIVKGPAIISANCFIAAHAYLRGGVFLGDKVTVGPGSEIKTSLIFDSTSLAHFNFVGDSIIGSFVNMEAGSVIANHFNERKEKEIAVRINGKSIKTGVTKFGALVGDETKIGANAVLSPGTILKPGSVVHRLELVDQNK